MRSPRRLLVACIAAVALFAGGPSIPAHAEEPIERSEDFTRDVDESIKEGVAWLLWRQRKAVEAAEDLNSAIELHTQARTYHALRVAGVPRTDPAMEAAYAALQKRYAALGAYNRANWSDFDKDLLGLLLMCIAEHGDPRDPAEPVGDSPIALGSKDSAWMREIVSFLERTQHADGLWQRSEKGSRQGERGDETDVDCTADVLLGLAAATRAGIRPNPSVWTKPIKTLRSRKGPRGDLVDGPHGMDEPWHLIAMILCRGESMAAKRGLSPRDQAFDEDIERAVREFFPTSSAISQLRNRRGEVMTLTFKELLAFEQAGHLLGLERFGDLDWYGVGAAALVGRQNLQYWSGAPGSDAWSDSVECTSYALRFLARGTLRVRTSGNVADGDADLNFAAAASLAPPELDDFVALVLGRWRKADDTALKDRLVAKTTAVGPKIVPPLLQRLASDSEDDRAAAIALLLRATGLDHGFVAEGPAAERTASIARWKAWWKEAEATLRYDPEKRLLVK